MNTLKLEVVRFDSEDVIATSLMGNPVSVFPNGYATLGAEAYEAGYDEYNGPINNESLYMVNLKSSNSYDFDLTPWIPMSTESGATYAWYNSGADAWYTDGKPVYHYTETGTQFPR